jgi:predicted nuclease of predicted toxin-antitoxin system
MTIWVDAQPSPVIARWMTEHRSLDGCHVGNLNLLDASDSKIFEATRAVGATIMTKDRDFLDLVQRHGSPPFIIWITCGNTSNAALIRTLRGAIWTACDLIKSGESIVEIGD